MLRGCIRVFLLILNAVTIAVGLAISAVGVYCIVKSRTAPLEEVETGNLVSLVVVTLVIGMLVLVVGVLGCSGSISQSPKLMNVYVCLVMLILLMEGACLLAALTARSVVVKRASEGFEGLVENYNSSSDESGRKAVDAVQRAMRCCGWEGEGDYSPAPPASCCQDEQEPCPTGEVFTAGCSSKLPSFIADTISLFAIVLGFGLALGLISVCGAWYVKKHSPKYNPIA